MTDLVVMPQLSSLLELAGRATIVFGVALAFAWLVRKGSATARHHLWTLTFALLLALPVLTLAGPSWDVPLLPSADRAADEALIEPLADLAGDSSFSATIDAAVPATTEVRPPWRSISLPLLLWGIGCGAALVSVGVGIFRFRQLVRSAQPVDDPEWHRQLEAVQSELGFRSDVSLRLGGETVTPMTGGLWSPVILLPTSASGWSAARRAVVLTHELVHVRRRDALRQLLGRVVLALYWFHPLSWVGSRLAGASREEACDEEVLAAGTRPSEYARHLLALGASMSRGQAVLSLPMVHPSQFERRIRAIVRRDRPRRRGLVTAVTLTALGAAGISASVANPVPVKTTPPAIAPPIAHQAIADDFVPKDCSFSSAEDWVLKRSLEDAVLCIGVNGDVVMSDDGPEVRAISASGSVVLESSGRRVHRLVITQGPAGLRHDWSIDGRERAFDDEARQWRDLMLALLQGSAPGLWQRAFGLDGGLRGLVWDERELRGLEAGVRAAERARFLQDEIDALQGLING